MAKRKISSSWRREIRVVLATGTYQTRIGVSDFGLRDAVAALPFWTTAAGGRTPPLTPPRIASREIRRLTSALVGGDGSSTGEANTSAAAIRDAACGCSGAFPGSRRDLGGIASSVPT